MSRKYRQPGYQESDREPPQRERDAHRPPPSRNLSDEERIQRRSLRHAVAREASEVVRCHECGGNVPGLGTIARDTTCPTCRAPLHCCRACRHFDTGARWQCRASIPAPVAAKNQPNDCAEYAARLVLDTTGRRSESPQSPGSAGPRAAFDSLFKR
jgi:hypothetical protein